MIPWGGQTPPISMAGDKLEWKKAQKILKKANTSLTINRITPIVNPFCTSNVWLPRYVPSVITSLNHKAIPDPVSANPKLNKEPPYG